MAEIVLGVGTSHGPMLSTPPHEWGARVPADRQAIHPFDGRMWTFDELVTRRRSENLAAQIELPIWEQRYHACRAALTKLAHIVAKEAPDVAVIFGNDQKEIFRGPVTPALSVFHGTSIVNSMYDEERIASLPPGIAWGIPGHIPEGGATYRGAAELGKHIIEELVRHDFDVTALSDMPGDETPHAYGFVYRQLMLDNPVPSVPIVFNTFYPPNQLGVRRCFDVGRAVARAVKLHNQHLKAALIASGGLTHFVIDERVDKIVLDAMRDGDIDKIASLGEDTFQSGTSEIKNWVALAGAMSEAGLTMNLIDYIPCYRSEAGTGNAMAFVEWR